MAASSTLGCAAEDARVAPALLDATETAFWIYAFDACRIVWANRAGLALWETPSVEALRARDLSAEMSHSVRARLAQHSEDFALDPGRVLHEFWTLYPEGRPARIRATLRAFSLDDGGPGMLVEARAEHETDTTTLRSADALLHTRVLTALFDASGAALYVNPAFRAAFGPGRHRFGADFIHAVDRERFLSGLEEAGAHRATVRVRTVDGERWHDIQAMRCRDAVTGDGAFLISASDVTTARVQKERLSRALDAAKAADLSKARFLATMSHEMRTPLNGVLGMASILGGTELTEAQRRALDVIAASGAQMLEMVEDMLDIVALDAQQIALQPAPFDPALLVRAGAESIRPEAERKALALEVDLRRLDGGRYVNDASRLRQALGHLLNNAVKFTDRGSIVVRAATTRDAGGARRLRFEVCDTGPGVPEAERGRVFERFHQVDGTATRRHGGSGLGLSICAELVRLWGGALGVACGEAGGSTFWFDAPAVVSAQDAPERPVVSRVGW